MKEQFEFTPVFYEAQVHTFDPDKWMQWADTWIVPLQDAEGTYSFLLIDSVTYQTLNNLSSSSVCIDRIWL